MLPAPYVPRRARAFLAGREENENASSGPPVQGHASMPRNNKTVTTLAVVAIAIPCRSRMQAKRYYAPPAWCARARAARARACACARCAALTYNGNSRQAAAADPAAGMAGSREIWEESPRGIRERSKCP